jgi:hypothetical protein
MDIPETLATRQTKTVHAHARKRAHNETQKTKKRRNKYTGIRKVIHTDRFSLVASVMRRV